MHYRFVDFSLDPPARELRRGGVLLTVSLKVLDCIVYLIEHRERAVGRDELIAVVWGRIDVTDVQLRHLVRKVRHALDDHDEARAVIRTIPGFGYKWAAETHCLDAPPPDPRIDSMRTTSTSAQSTEATPTAAGALTAKTRESSKHTIRTAAVGVAVLVAVLCVIVGYPLQIARIAVGHATRASKTHQAAPLVAVLPVYVAEGGGGDSSWVPLGMMDLIAGRLRAARLPVVPSSDITALTRNDNAISVRSVRAATGARAVVTTSLQREDDGWHLALSIDDDDVALHRVDIRSANAVVAAQEASDRLLEAFGVTETQQSSLQVSTTEFLQRVEAALLIDDFAGARQIIEAAPSGVLELPEAKFDGCRIEAETGASKRARNCISKLLALLSGKDDALLRARTLALAGIVNLDQPAFASEQFSEAIRLLDSLNEPDFLGAAYNGRGVAYEKAGRYDEAAADYARARIAFTMANNTLGLARVDNNEAVLDRWHRRPTDALPLFVRSAHQFERMGALDSLMNPLTNEITTYLDLLRPADALAVFQQFATRFDHLDNSANTQIWKLQGVTALIANGQIAEARAALDDVARTIPDDSPSVPLALAAAARADVEFEAKSFDLAVLAAKQAVAAMAVLHHEVAEDRAHSWLVLIRALRRLQRNAEANAELERFSAWSHGETLRRVTLSARIAEAERSMQQGRHAAAFSAFDDLLRETGDGGAPIDIAAVSIVFGDALLYVGDPHRAAAVIGQVARWADTDFASAVAQATLYLRLGDKGASSRAVDRARSLAGERALPPELAAAPVTSLTSR